ncbi:hypothetical protein OSA14_04815, partial [Treponema pallidum]
LPCVSCTEQEARQTVMGLRYSIAGLIVSDCTPSGNNLLSMLFQRRSQTVGKGHLVDSLLVINLHSAA